MACLYNPRNLRLLKIVREQSAQRNQLHGHMYNSVGSRNKMLCGDCNALSYCQLARNLSHTHAASLNSEKIINGALDQQTGVVLDQQIMAERLKIRYKTCPFHRELSFG